MYFTDQTANQFYFYTPADAEPLTVRKPTVFECLYEAYYVVKLWNQRRKAITELQSLSNRTLCDIGVSRSEIRATVYENVK